ncbi:MAG: radical SAM protein [Nitrososphaerota archaeon]|nr:radical SAM protein [Candidatus Bathyarchaeota archaeon]MDW8023771.1 radical SAM protein [Nitrososphaerota archaeon]
MKTFKLNEVCLEITAKCPLNCLHCSGDCTINSKDELSLDEIKRVIDELSILGCETLEISGGEPLLHQDLINIISYAKTRNIEPILYTSGNMLNASGKIAGLNITIAKNLRAVGLKKMIFGLHGFRKGTHEAITKVTGSYSNVIRAIKITKSLGLWVGVHFVPMKLNYKELEDLLRLCHDLRVDEVGILRFVPQGRGEINNGLLKLSSPQFIELTEKLAYLTLNHKNPTLRVGRPIDFRFLINSSITKTVCDAGISRCLISPDGKVVPCPGFKQNSQFIAGNIKNNSLIKIWRESPVWQRLRKFDYTKIKEPCNSCKKLPYCRGGCIAQKTLTSNSDVYSAPDACCFFCYVKSAAKH